MCVSFTGQKEECELCAMRTEGLPWKPAVQGGWPANQVEVVGFVHGKGFMDVTVGVDVCSHGAVQRQATGRQKDDVIRTDYRFSEASSQKTNMRHKDSNRQTASLEDPSLQTHVAHPTMGLLNHSYENPICFQIYEDELYV